MRDTLSMLELEVSRMVSPSRMDKAAFLKALEGRGPDELRTLLWTAYWRGTAGAKDRIEEMLRPKEAAERREMAAHIDPAACLEEVEAFCARARAGDYMRGARDLGRKEVSGWRLTFRRLFDDSARALQQPDGDSQALACLLDFTCDLKDWEYFRTQDPVEAAKIVFSDRVESLWRFLIDREGFGAFLKNAPGQFLRWENPWGWTRYDGSTSEKERPLADVLMGLLPGADAMQAFARSYLAALDILKPRPASPQEVKFRSSRPQDDWRSDCRHRSSHLARWHGILLERLADQEDQPLLERILSHPALDGPETWHHLARLRQRQGRHAEAGTLVRKALDRLPGSRSIQATVLELGIKDGAGAGQVHPAVR